MRFFFVPDHHCRHRYFSSEALSQIQVNFSRWKKLWELAKKKLMLLPPRILRQEQAFEKALKLKEQKIEIFHSGNLDEKKIKSKFHYFLQKQRTKHILLLIGETLLLPLSGLAALLPGPNVFFGVLALLMITHWNALRGINRMFKKEYVFISSSLFMDWEEALEGKKEDIFSQLLKKIEKEYNIQNLHKILWK